MPSGPASASGTRYAAFAVIGLSLLLVASACGSASEKVYRGAAVVAGARSVARVSVPAQDFISSEAPISFDFALPNGDSGTVAVWGTVGKAQATIADIPLIAQAFTKALGGAAKPHTERHGNVTVFWDQPPSSVDEYALQRMLAGRSASPSMSATSTTDAWAIAGIAVGSSEPTVIRQRGTGHRESCAGTGCADIRSYGPVTVQFEHGKVASIYCASPGPEGGHGCPRHFALPDGVTLGTRVPSAAGLPGLPRALTTHWRGYRKYRPSEPQYPISSTWKKTVRINGAPVTVYLATIGRKVAVIEETAP